jgi:hypothetical protein
MKKIRPLFDYSDMTGTDFPKVSWREITINVQIQELCIINGGVPVSQDEIIIGTIFCRNELFDSLSRLSKIGVIKKTGSGKNKSRYINLRNFYE